MKDVYAQALLNVIAQGTSEDVALKNMFTELKAQGRTKLLPQILQSLKTLTLRARANVSVLEVAGPSDKNQAKADGVVAEEVKTNETLLSGYRVRNGSTLVDKSGKRALIDLYHAITHA